MTTQHTLPYPSKIICVGRNYAKHAAELGNQVPAQPVLFLKPASSLILLEQGITLPSSTLGELHYECELCVQIGQPLYQALSLEQARQSIAALTLGLDLTLRDVQNELKAKGLPWERAKAFDGSCLLADWIPIQDVQDNQQLELNKLSYQLMINDEVRQVADTSDMLFSIETLIVDISQVFSLQIGDVIMTGTPEGVGALHSGDKLAMKFANHIWHTQVN